jgi:hypothetical protein
MFPEKWIGKFSPITCLTLIPLDVFFWRYIKDAVYVPPLATTFLELAEMIRATMVLPSLII